MDRKMKEMKKKWYKRRRYFGVFVKWLDGASNCILTPRHDTCVTSYATCPHYWLQMAVFMQPRTNIQPHITCSTTVYITIHFAYMTVYIGLYSSVQHI